jgi:hypothetical protein
MVGGGADGYMQGSLATAPATSRLMQTAACYKSTLRLMKVTMKRVMKSPPGRY